MHTLFLKHKNLPDVKYKNNSSIYVTYFHASAWWYKTGKNSHFGPDMDRCKDIYVYKRETEHNLWVSGKQFKHLICPLLKPWWSSWKPQEVDLYVLCWCFLENHLKLRKGINLDFILPFLLLEQRLKNLNEINFQLEL